MKILAIESSCDETAAAVIEDGRKICSNIINSQAEEHALYGGVVPDSIEELTKLPGVGRKTANLICGDIYGQPSYVCDTHCIRITNLLGLSSSKDPHKVEMQLREKIPPEKSTAFCHRMVLLGREYCIARRPRCGQCPLRPYCPGHTEGPC